MTEKSDEEVVFSGGSRIKSPDIDQAANLPVETVKIMGKVATSEEIRGVNIHDFYKRLPDGISMAELVERFLRIEIPPAKMAILDDMEDVVQKLMDGGDVVLPYDVNMETLNPRVDDTDAEFRQRLITMRNGGQVTWPRSISHMERDNPLGEPDDRITGGTTDYLLWWEEDGVWDVHEWDEFLDGFLHPKIVGGFIAEL